MSEKLAVVSDQCEKAHIKSSEQKIFVELNAALLEYMPRLPTN